MRIRAKEIRTRRKREADRIKDSIRAIKASKPAKPTPSRPAPSRNPARSSSGGSRTGTVTRTRKAAAPAAEVATPTPETTAPTPSE